MLATEHLPSTPDLISFTSDARERHNFRFRAKSCTIKTVLGIMKAFRLKDKFFDHLAFHPPAVPGYAIDDNRNYFLTFGRSETELSCPRDLMPENSPISYEAHLLPSTSVKKNLAYSVPVLVLRHAKAAQSSPVLLFSHGTSTDLGYSFSQMYYLCSKLQVTVVSYDYPGYGLAKVVNPSEEDANQSIRTVYQFVRREMGVDGSKIVVYGQSIGSTPTCDLCSDFNNYPVAGMILHSPIASALKVIDSKISDSRFDCFQNAERIRSCPWPALIIHGRNDDLVSLDNSSVLLRSYLRPLPESLKRSLELMTHLPTHDSFRSLDSSATPPSCGSIQSSNSPLCESTRCSSMQLDEEALGLDSDKSVTTDGSDYHSSLSSDNEWRRTLSEVSSAAGISCEDVEQMLMMKVHTWVVPNARHNDLEMVAGPKYFTVVGDFLAAYVEDYSNPRRRYEEQSVISH